RRGGGADRNARIRRTGKPFECPKLTPREWPRAATFGLSRFRHNRPRVHHLASATRYPVAPYCGSMRKPHLIHLVYLIHLMALPLMAQGTGEADLPRLTGTIRLDGVLDDEAWRSVAPLPLTMYLPTFRGAPSESTEIRVAYDAEFIYACGRFHDSDPAHMRVNSLYRDRYSGDDAFGFYLDT